MNINDNIAAVQAAISANASRRQARPASDPVFDQLLAAKNASPVPQQPNPIQRRMGAANTGPTNYSNGNYRGAMDQGAADLNHVDPVLRSAVAKMIKDSGGVIGTNSGYRDSVRQTGLYNAALSKYGNARNAGAWVAPPGQSPHNKGEAIDLNLSNAAAIAYAHANAAKYGLVFPLANENWHVERKGWRQQNGT